MRKVVLIAAGVLFVSVGVSTQQGTDPSQLATPPAKQPGWAFPVQEVTLPNLDPAGPRTVPGSTKKYTQEEIDNLLAPPDWFPNDHPPAPSIVTKGHGGALACGSCHLMSGIGHPESGDVTGLDKAYFLAQMADFKSGARKDYARMNGIAKELSDEEIMQAADYFTQLKPQHNNTVEEKDPAPKTVIAQGRMRFVDPKGGTEPVGNRILTVPTNVAEARMRDPKTTFVSYVAPGTLARGNQLVEMGDRTKAIIACGTCHGKDMKGNTLKGANGAPGTPVPRLAGVHPMYLARELVIFKDGSRAGANAKLMAPTVKNMTDEDIVAIAAYLASLDPK